jgi:DNA-directed RNA polymerase specialized sigma24 family protein
MIIRMHSRTLFAIAYGILQSREEAEDVVQDSLVEAWKMRQRNHVEYAHDWGRACLSRGMGNCDRHNYLECETRKARADEFRGAHAARVHVSAPSPKHNLRNQRNKGQFD